jgi:hypothetical protein
MLAAPVLAQDAEEAVELAPEAATDVAPEGFALRGSTIVGPVLAEQTAGRVRPEGTMTADDRLLTGAIGPTAGGQPTANPEPFEPLGIPVGSFLLYPKIEATVEHSVPDIGDADTLLRLTPELRLQSDWTRHEAVFSLRGNYESGLDGGEGSWRDGEAEGAVRVDIDRDRFAEAGFSYALSRQESDDPDYPALAVDEPLIHEIDANIAYERSVGPFLLRLEGIGGRTVFEDAHDAADTPIDQGDRTNTVYEARARVGYELLGALTPFVDLGIGRRVYDRTVDMMGFERSSNFYRLRGGIIYDSAPVLNAELALGFYREEPDDAALQTLDAWTIDGSILWSPRELLTVTVDASTTFRPPDPDGPGSIFYEVDVDAAYAYRENFDLHALMEFAAEKLDGGAPTYTYALGAEAVWRMNRTLALAARYMHEWKDPLPVEGAEDTVSVSLTASR